MSSPKVRSRTSRLLRDKPLSPSSRCRPASNALAYARARKAAGESDFTRAGRQHPGLGEMVEYYTRVLGEPGFSDSGYTGWMFGSAYVTVGTHDQVKGKNAHPGRIIWNMESQDVHADFEQFKAAGAIVVAEPYAFEGQEGSAIATFADPTTTTSSS